MLKWARNFWKWCGEGEKIPLPQLPRIRIPKRVPPPVVRYIPEPYYARPAPPPPEPVSRGAGMFKRIDIQMSGPICTCPNAEKTITWGIYLDGTRAGLKIECSACGTELKVPWKKFVAHFSFDEDDDEDDEEEDEDDEEEDEDDEEEDEDDEEEEPEREVASAPVTGSRSWSPLPDGIQGRQGCQSFQGLFGIQGYQGPGGIGQQGYQGPQDLCGGNGLQGPLGFADKEEKKDE